jgi:hypothetical protein
MEERANTTNGYIADRLEKPEGWLPQIPEQLWLKLDKWPLGVGVFSYAQLEQVRFMSR